MEMLVFQEWGGGGPEYMEESPQSKMKTNQKLNQQEKPPRTETRPHWWEASPNYNIPVPNDYWTQAFLMQGSQLPKQKAMPWKEKY